MQKTTTFLVLSIFAQTSFSQLGDSSTNIFHFKGAVTVTTKGISLVPTFTLGKPAVIFDLSMGKRKFFFEPQFKFSLTGKPWAFLFWGRYKLITTSKFAFTVGMHPAISFRTDSFIVGGVKDGFTVARRYLAGELVPNYFISKNISIGLYYLFSSGLDNGTTKDTHFLTINSNFSHIKLSNQFYAKFAPQFYYLNQDGNDGIYFSCTLTLGKMNFPVTIQSILNKTIETDITASKDIWNISLIYSFNNEYVREQ